MKQIFATAVGLMLGIGGTLQTIQAQAYCALRDPISAMQQANLSGDTYRSIVHEVSNETREKVRERLPFTIHPKELGAHTLYVVSQEKKPQSLIHVRTEKGKWGLIEIAWFFDLDLKVQGFRFQRCRDRNESFIKSPSVQSQLAGLGFDDLKKLLSADGNRILPLQLNVPAGSEDLAATVVRSALKTIAVTELVWGNEISTLRGSPLRSPVDVTTP